MSIESKVGLGVSEKVNPVVIASEKCKKHVVRNMVCGRRQMLPILTYGAELHNTPVPTEDMVGLTRECSRWVVGTWRGSNAERAEVLGGIDELEGPMHRKRIRWAATVYARDLLMATTPQRGRVYPKRKYRTRH